MYDMVHGRLSEMIFIDTDIDAPTPEGDMPGECMVRPAMRMSCANLANGMRQFRANSRLKRQQEIDAKWAKIDPYLGTMTDNAVAKKFGKSYGAVNGRRTKLGIAAYEKPLKYPWEEIDPLLGTTYDAELARKFGCSVSAIKHRREKLGVPSFLP